MGSAIFDIINTHLCSKVAFVNLGRNVEWALAFIPSGWRWISWFLTEAPTLPYKIDKTSLEYAARIYKKKKLTASFFKLSFFSFYFFHLKLFVSPEIFHLPNKVPSKAEPTVISLDVGSAYRTQGPTRRLPRRTLSLRMKKVRLKELHAPNPSWCLMDPFWTCGAQLHYKRYTNAELGISGCGSAVWKVSYSFSL